MNTTTLRIHSNCFKADLELFGVVVSPGEHVTITSVSGYSKGMDCPLPLEFCFDNEKICRLEPDLKTTVITTSAHFSFPIRLTNYTDQPQFFGLDSTQITPKDLKAFKGIIKIESK